MPVPVESASTPPFQMEAWRIYPDRNTLENDDGPVLLEPRQMQVLVCLAKGAGAVVTRDQLLDAVWHEVIVNEAALTRTISELRKILGDNSKEPRFIQTIRKTGYRLIAPVEPLSPLPEARPLSPKSRSASTQSRPRRSWLWVAGAIASLGVVFAFSLWPSTAPSETTLLRAQPFTTYPGQERFPALSPDGSRVAFIRTENDQTDLFIKQSNTETPLRLTDDPAFEMRPTWSPDGSTLAFARADSGSVGLYTIPAIGGPLRKLIDVQSRVPGLAWSPNGQMLVLAQRTAPEGPYHLFTLALSDLTLEPLTEAPAQHRGDTNPAFSPDGETLAFTRTNRVGGQDLFLMDTSTRQLRRITNEHRGINGLAWLPDGEALVFSSYRNGTYSLWRVDTSTGALAWIPTTADRIYNPTVALHANRLVFEAFRYEKNVWHIERTDTGFVSHQFINSTQWDWESAYAPARDRVAFISSRSGTLEIWIADGDGSNPVQRTTFGGAAMGNPRWSPDGQHLSFHASPDGHAALYVLDAAGGSVRQLTDPAVNTINASWSRDGNSLYAGSDRSGDWNVWKINATTGQAVQVTSTGGFLAFESPDGQHLYYNKVDARGIWQRPLAGGAETQIIDDLLLAYWGDWIVRQSGIYYARPHAGQAWLIHYTFADKSTTRLTPLPRLGTPSLFVSADERSILHASLEASESDLMLIEDFR